MSHTLYIASKSVFLTRSPCFPRYRDFTEYDLNDDKFLDEAEINALLKGEGFAELFLSTRQFLGISKENCQKTYCVVDTSLAR